MDLLGTAICLMQIVPLADRSVFGANAVPILSALGAGAIASLITGYFSKPKTKAEADQAKVVSDVSLSADAREWAQLWMKRSEDAQAEATAAKTDADTAHAESRGLREQIQDLETQIEGLEALVAGYMAWWREVTRVWKRIRPSADLPKVPAVVQDWIDAHGGS